MDGSEQKILTGDNRGLKSNYVLESYSNIECSLMSVVWKKKNSPSSNWHGYQS